MDDSALVVQALLGTTDRHGQLAQIAAAQIAQFDALDIVPGALVRVQVGGIAGQLLQVQALGGARAQELLDRMGAMDGRAVSDDQQLATHLAQQPLQEAHDILGVVRSLLRLHEQAPRRRDPTDGGEMLARERHAQHPRLPAWRPGAYRHGQQIEAGLIVTVQAQAE